MQHGPVALITTTVLVSAGLISLCTSSSSSSLPQQDEGRPPARRGRFLSVFQVVTFPNDPCSSSGSRNGTCYTASECSSRGGTDSGSCASGFGVCCTFVEGCGVTSSENCTYFEVSGASAGECSFTACPCGNNICQLRLDFQTFVIAGPATVTSSQFKTLNGNIANVADAIPANMNTVCNTDTFSVTSPGSNSPPTICGSNSGDHMYVDSSTACNDLNFQIGTASSSASRSWSIKVTQYSCNFENLAPDGCTQYYFGSNTDTFQSYNYDGSHHLANQDQAICFRQERGNCRICYTQVSSANDLQISDVTNRERLNPQVSCCGYGTNGQGARGYDCVIIPGAEKTNGDSLGRSRYCMRNAGFATGPTDANEQKTICTTMQPFIFRFMSDSFEFAGLTPNDPMNPREGSNNDAGFRLAYIMDSINCP